MFYKLIITIIVVTMFNNLIKAIKYNNSYLSKTHNIISNKANSLKLCKQIKSPNLEAYNSIISNNKTKYLCPYPRIDMFSRYTNANSKDYTALKILNKKFDYEDYLKCQ